MGITSGIKWYFKPFFNVRGWVDAERLGKQTRDLRDTLKSIAIPDQAHYSETYEEAVQRLDLSEQEIQTRMGGYKLTAVIIFMLMFAIIAYGIELLMHGSYRGGIVALAVSMVAFGQGFKFHFWYYQLKKRKFGCTFKEWLREGFRG